MKKVLVIIAVAVLLALDYAALDDITTGSEPDYFLEYLTLALSPVVFGSLFLWRNP